LHELQLLRWLSADVPIPKLMDAYNHYVLSGNKRQALVDRLHWHWSIEPEDRFSTLHVLLPLRGALHAEASDRGSHPRNPQDTEGLQVNGGALQRANMALVAATKRSICSGVPTVILT
jgi:hypothetical protein